MEVILREEVQHLGAAGDVVKVKDGYARNFLLPKGLAYPRSEEHTSELQSQSNLVCRLLLEKKNNRTHSRHHHADLPADVSPSLAKRRHLLPDNHPHEFSDHYLLPPPDDHRLRLLRHQHHLP